jgi:hypothetical protein
MTILRMNLESKLTTFDCRLLTLDYIVIASEAWQSHCPNEIASSVSGCL